MDFDLVSGLKISNFYIFYVTPIPTLRLHLPITANERVFDGWIIPSKNLMSVARICNWSDESSIFVFDILLIPLLIIIYCIKSKTKAMETSNFATSQVGRQYIAAYIELFLSDTTI